MRFAPFGAAFALMFAIGAVARADAPETAFVMVATDSATTASNETLAFSFRQIDLQTLAFIGERTDVVLRRDEFDAPAGTSARFGGKALAPGDYALIARARTTSGRGTSRVETCYSYGAPIFRFAEGVVSVVPEDEFAAEQAVRDVQDILRAHPEITAPAARAEPLGSVSFDTVVRRQQEVCEPSGPLSFRPPLPPTQ